MANSFSGDPYCKAVWRFENGALTTDSKGTNTLTNNGTVTSSTGDYKEGSASADFEKDSSQYFSISDSSLNSGFPFKNGDTNKKISLCFWFKLESNVSSTAYFFSKYDAGSNKRSFAALIQYVDSMMKVSINQGYNSGNSYESLTFDIGVSTGVWYHVGITYDDTTREGRIRVWNATSSSLVGSDHTKTFANNINVEDAQVCIGRRSDASGWFDGKIDELVVFNDILSVSEIDAIRAGTYTGTSPSTSKSSSISASPSVSISSSPSVSISASPSSALTSASSSPSVSISASPSSTKSHSISLSPSASLSSSPSATVSSSVSSSPSSSPSTSISASPSVSKSSSPSTSLSLSASPSSTPSASPSVSFDTALLLELAPIHGIWEDSDGGIWTDSAGGIWENGISLLASQEGFSGNRWWGDYILEIDPPQYQLANIYGGYCSLGWGSVTLAQEMFNSDAFWPPLKKIPCAFYFTTTTENDAELIFRGSAHLESWDKNGVVYDLYGYEHDVDLLSTTTLLSEEVITLPRAFGTVTFETPIQLDDDEGRPTYHKAYLYGDAGSDWHVYDDGINIDANVFDNGDGTFSLTSSPVGEVSVSGVGEINTLDELFGWACGSDYLSIGYDNTLLSESIPTLSFWADSQEKLIDFLSDVSAYFTHLFYIYEDKLYIVDMNKNNGSSTYTYSDITPARYFENSPVSTFKSKWRERSSFSGKTSDPDDAIKTYYIKEEEKETLVPTSYSYGNEMNLDAYTAEEADKKIVLNNIKSIVESVNASVGIPMEVGDLPVPGKLISWSEPSYLEDGPHIKDVFGSIRARTIIYDFKNYTVNIVGEGTVSTTSSSSGFITDEEGELIGDGIGGFIEDGI